MALSRKAVQALRKTGSGDAPKVEAMASFLTWRQLNPVAIGFGLVADVRGALTSARLMLCRKKCHAAIFGTSIVLIEDAVAR